MPLAPLGDKISTNAGGLFSPSRMEISKMGSLKAFDASALGSDQPFF
jgi:hypothetical protein